MKRVHYIDNYLINPQHPVTVNLIGAGGTGSQVLTGLARLDVTLRALGHPGLFVTLYDPDIVTEANIGRQLFGYSDMGLNKAQCLITRINNFFGNDWKAVPDIFPVMMKNACRDNMANITITCTGWFKVVFVALDATGKPTGKEVEYYLANFDSSKDAESGLTNKIRTGWNQLDLSGLGDSVCTVAINFEGSDSSAYGLNTPAYVAIDDIDVTVNE